MAQDTDVKNLIINKLTRAQYESIANPDPTQLYFITDEVISSTDVTNALGYTPYNSSNPNGYTSNVGTVTSVNNIQPDANGNVVISTHNVGEIIPSTLPLTDAGLHLLDGALLQYGIYKEFIDYIADLYVQDPTANYFTTESAWQASVSTYGSCGKFVYSPNDNTVRLPKITGIVEGTIDIETLGNITPQDVLLPNIYGSYNAPNMQDPSGTGTGAFAYGGGAGFGTPSVSQDAKSYGFNFSAARVSSVYSGNGSNTKIQPQSTKVFYYIVIANSTKAKIQVDIDQVATDLNGKADTDLSNVTDTGYIKMAGAGMPSDKYIDLTLGASGSTYTAPANGFIYIDKIATNAQYMALANLGTDRNRIKVGVQTAHTVNKQHVELYVPVKKGDIVRVNYSLGGNTTSFRFIYAQGSESEAS